MPNLLVISTPSFKTVRRVGCIWRHGFYILSTWLSRQSFGGKVRGLYYCQARWSPPAARILTALSWRSGRSTLKPGVFMQSTDSKCSTKGCSLRLMEHSQFYSKIPALRVALHQLLVAAGAVPEEAQIPVRVVRVAEPSAHEHEPPVDPVTRLARAVLAISAAISAPVSGGSTSSASRMNTHSCGTAGFPRPSFFSSARCR